MVWLKTAHIRTTISAVVANTGKWHFVGTCMQKQNVFDDFIAAGEFLIKGKYTSSHYLAIAGGSNGGCWSRRHDTTPGSDAGCLAFGRRFGYVGITNYGRSGMASDYGTARIIIHV
jgi:prolyl oligopeptidase